MKSRDLNLTLSFEGAVIIILGGLIGTGFSETALLHTPGYFVVSRTAEILQKDRIRRRDQQFVFMIITVIMGMILMAIGFLVDRFLA